MPAIADAFWDLLADSNNALARSLMHLSELHTKDATSYSTCVARLSSLQSSQVRSGISSVISATDAET